VEVYKYFYPHFNPLHFNTPLRQQELAELAQSAVLLRRAVEFASHRNARIERRRVNQEQLESALKALRYVERVLLSVEDAHPGDSDQDLDALAKERKDLPGWKSWASIVEADLKRSASKPAKVA
jgi:hypothetical protein